MRKQSVVLTVIVAALTSVVTSAFWAEVTPATAGVHNIYKVVTGINYKGVIGPNISASPGNVQRGSAECPTGNGWQVISGGFIESGHDGAADGTVTRSAPKTPGWDIVVSDPKLADGSVDAVSVADCIQPVYTTISVTP